MDWRDWKDAKVSNIRINGKELTDEEVEMLHQKTQTSPDGKEPFWMYVFKPQFYLHTCECFAAIFALVAIGKAVAIYMKYIPYNTMNMISLFVFTIAAVFLLCIRRLIRVRWIDGIPQKGEESTEEKAL